MMVLCWNMLKKNAGWKCNECWMVQSRAHDDIIVIAAEEEERVTSENPNQAEFPRVY